MCASAEGFIEIVKMLLAHPGNDLELLDVVRNGYLYFIDEGPGDSYIWFLIMC